MTTRRTAAADVQAAGAGTPQRVSGAAVEPRQGLPSHGDLPVSGVRRIFASPVTLVYLGYLSGAVMDASSHHVTGAVLTFVVWLAATVILVCGVWLAAHQESR